MVSIEFVANLLIANGVFFVPFSMIMHTKNIQSCLLFKIIPFSLGVVTIIAGASLKGWI